MPLLPQKANTAENSDKLDDRSPLPAGEYVAHIVKTEYKATKAGTGHYLSMHFSVLEGESKGRMFFTNLNLDNPNPVAVEIANKELNSICAACNQEGVEDSDELLQIPMNIKLKVTPGNDDWPPSNEVVTYSLIEDGVAAAQIPIAEAAKLVAVAADEPAPVKKAEPAEEKKKLPWE